MLFGIDRNFTVIVEGVTLKGLFPLPKEEREIDLQVAERLRFSPINSIPPNTYNYEYICVLLNNVIKDRPHELKDFSEVYQVDFTMQVFSEYSKKKKEFDESLKKNNSTGNNNDIRERSGNDTQPLFDEKLPSKTRKVT